MTADDEKVWIVRVGDKQRGPVSLAQIRRAIKAGRLGADAEIARQGTDEWCPAEPAFSTLTDAGNGSSLGPATSFRLDTDETDLVASPSSRVRLYLMGGLLAALLAAGTGGWFAYRSFARANPTEMPIVAKKLPPRTTLVSEGRIGPFREDVAVLPDGYVAAALAHGACGTQTDLVDTLALARGKDIAWLKNNGILDLATDESIRRAFACANAIRGSLSSQSEVVVNFQDDKPREVLVVRSRLGELPAELGFVRHNFSGLPGQCQHSAGDKVDCPSGTVAAVHDGPTWIFGALEAVESFARAYTTSRDELTTTVDILQATIASTEPSDLVTVSAKPDSILWSGPCLQAAPVGHLTEFMDACFPKGQEKLLEGITTKVRGLAIERNVLARAEGYKWSFVLLLRDEDAARDVEKDLQDLSRDWRAQLENGETAMARLLREPSDYVQDHFWEAAFDPYVRAIRNMRVSRSGSVVRLTLAERLRPEEAKSIREFVATRTQDQVALSAVVDALVQNVPLPEKSLAVFVGTETAAWIAAPRASVADCQQLSDKVSTLTRGDVPIELFGVKYELERRFGAKACTGMVLPLNLKQCFLSAPDLPGIASCKPPRSPYAAGAQDKLEGQWEAEAVHGDGASWSVRAALTRARIEFGGGRVAFWAGGALFQGDAEVRSESMDRASFAITFKGAVVRKEVQFEKADTIKIIELADNVDDVVFKRSKFDASLITADAGVGQQ